MDVPLTTDGGQNVQPAWSPDGSLIAFHSYRSGGVWVVPARGGTPRQIATAGSRPACHHMAGGSSTSRRSMPTTPSGFNALAGSTLMIADANGNSARPLTQAGGPLAATRRRRGVPMDALSRLPCLTADRITAFGSSTWKAAAPNGCTVAAAVRVCVRARRVRVVCRRRRSLHHAAAVRRRQRRAARSAGDRPCACVPGVRGLSISPKGAWGLPACRLTARSGSSR